MGGGRGGEHMRGGREARKEVEGVMGRHKGERRQAKKRNTRAGFGRVKQEVDCQALGARVS